MQKLDNNWLTSDPIDFEYKKYLLLAYDQASTNYLDQKKIYPYLTDIIDKIKIVNEFLSNTKKMEESKTSVVGFDLKNMQAVTQSLVDDKSLNEIKAIAQFSKEILVDLYMKFSGLLEEVNNNIIISGCKVEIFNPYTGFIILKYDNNKEKILYYEVIRKIHPHPHFVLKTYKADLTDYYDARFKKNVFDVIFKEMYPLKETNIPVFRKKFLLNILGFRD